MCDKTKQNGPTLKACVWLSCHPSHHTQPDLPDHCSVPSPGHMKTIFFRETQENAPEKHTVKEGVYTVEGDEFWIPRMHGTNLQRENSWVGHWEPCPDSHCLRNVAEEAVLEHPKALNSPAPLNTQNSQVFSWEACHVAGIE